MQPLDQSTWIVRLTEHLTAAGIGLGQIGMIAEPMYRSANRMTPEAAAETYLEMMVHSGLVERRAQWRGLS